MRTRISTTVDGIKWRQAMSLMNSPASQVVDRALEALIDRLEAESEIRALDEFPYDEDPELAWEAEPVALPYEGDVPEAIRRQAAQRKRPGKQ